MDIEIIGPVQGSDAGNLTVTVGAASDSDTFDSINLPDALTGRPFLNDVVAGVDIVPQLTGLTNPVLQFISNGVDIPGATTAPFDTASRAGQQVSLRVVADEGTFTSPPILVRHAGMMSHVELDNAAAALFPHNITTHIPTGDGDWKDPATWVGGRVPKNGAAVLIPHGVRVVYDEDRLYQLYRVRVDGELVVTTAAMVNIEMLVDTVYVSKSGHFIVGTFAQNIPASSKFTCAFSGQDYLEGTRAPTNLRASEYEATRGLARGFICQGKFTAWGNELTSWLWGAEGITAGSQSTTLSFDPIGWEPGMRVVIGGTAANYVYNGEFTSPMDLQDEEVTLTVVTGNYIEWEEPLQYNHNNQLVVSNRVIVPAIALIEGHNIVFRSQIPDDRSKRGHFMMMHADALPDIWDVHFASLGRTDKAISGGIFEGGQFKFNDDVVFTPSFSPLDVENNLIGSYACHLHHPAADWEAQGHAHPPRIFGSLATDVIGWGFVHHGGFAEIFNSVVYGVKGGGFIGERADETGIWSGNLCIHTTNTNGFIGGTPKNIDGTRGYNGDHTAYGYGFGMKGRFLTMSRNFAVSMTWAFVLNHRATLPATYVGVLSPVMNPSRDNLPMKGLGRAYGPYDTFDYRKHPLPNFSRNGAMACYGGFFVTKTNARQNHGMGIPIIEFSHYGAIGSGWSSEYIKKYNLIDCDFLAGPFADGALSAGFLHGGSTYQVVNKRTRVEGFGKAARYVNDNITSIHDKFSQDDPRHIEISLHSLNNTVGSQAEDPPTASTKTGADVVVIEPDWDNTRFDEAVDPYTTYPFVLGQYDGSNILNFIDNTDGKLVDQLNALGEIAPMADDDTVFVSSGARISTVLANEGYYSHSGGDVIAQPFLISDRATLRPALETHIYEYTAGSKSGTDNGALGYSTNPVLQSDLFITCPFNGRNDSNEQTVNPTTGATGGNGTFRVYDQFYIPPDHGDLSIDHGTGICTYKPHKGFRGTDKFTTMVESGWQFKTVVVNVLVGGVGGSVAAPVIVTNFDLADNGDGTFKVTLKDEPFVDERFIRVVQYQTDSDGWRWFSNRWIADEYDIDVRSDGSALPSGAVDVQIRCLLDYDPRVGPASSATEITLT